jgi:fatty acid/phospholipid biosynthesis enzyme
MPLTNAGRDAIASRLINDTTTIEFDNANAKIGVGDSNAAFAVAQTDLQAAANKFRKAMDATFPTIAGNALTFKSTFASAEANFAWQEWAVFNAAAAGTMLNRVVEYNGTKLVGQTWILQVTLTVNIGV